MKLIYCTFVLLTAIHCQSQFVFDYVKIADTATAKVI